MPLTVSGQLSLLRVNERGDRFGPQGDSIEAEVVVQFRNQPGKAFGFQLRDDGKLPARQGMLELLRDAFNHSWTANIDHETPAGKNNGIITRVWLTKPAGLTTHPVGVGHDVLTTDM